VDGEKPVRRSARPGEERRGAADVLTSEPAATLTSSRALSASPERLWRRRLLARRGTWSCLVTLSRRAVAPETHAPCQRLPTAGLAAPARGEHLLRAMSRPSSVSPRPPAPGGSGGAGGGGSGGAGGGGGVGPAQCGPGGGGRAKGLKDIRIDEEVKIAVNIALERFRYGDQRGEVPAWTPPRAPPAVGLGAGEGRTCLTSVQPGRKCPLPCQRAVGVAKPLPVKMFLKQV
jgi:hypothetical protein